MSHFFRSIPRVFMSDFGVLHWVGFFFQKEMSGFMPFISFFYEMSISFDITLETNL